MIYEKGIRTLYISSKTSDRLVRYDIVSMSDGYLVKVFDTLNDDSNHPKMLMEVHEKMFTYEGYDRTYGSGPFQMNVSTGFKPNFSQYVESYCQKHRNSIR
ncbi:TPA: hypothetical protein I8372_001479 [Citrobacter farmeri]|nr:hypothetical protein [Citrobacter farmeri]HAT2776373.1 hypothetical protein [Citrobacter farmeri]HAT2807338.1 hypothetical protein [Citrobacter farmeri]HBC0547154.1 hypothetical protein [Citrobacter farmeri]